MKGEDGPPPTELNREDAKKAQLMGAATWQVK